MSLTISCNQAVFYTEHPISHNKPHQNPKFSMKPNLKIIEMFHVKHCPIIYNNRQSKLHITPPNPIVSHYASQLTLPKSPTSPFPPPHTHHLWQNTVVCIRSTARLLPHQNLKTAQQPSKTQKNTIKPLKS